MCEWRLAGLKIRVGALTNENCVLGEIISSFLDRGFSLKQSERSAKMWRRFRNAHVLLHVRANGDSPVSLAMTHVRWVHGQGGHESTDCNECVSSVSMGCVLGPSIGARTITWAEVNARRRPLV